MEKLIQYAKKNGYTFQLLYANSNDENTATGILIDTDYYGPYAPKEVYALHDKIRKDAARRGWTTEVPYSRVCIFVHLNSNKLYFS